MYYVVGFSSWSVLMNEFKLSIYIPFLPIDKYRRMSLQDLREVVDQGESLEMRWSAYLWKESLHERMVITNTGPNS